MTNFKDHLGLLRKVSWTYSKSTGIEFKELFQEASLAYLKAMETYTPEKGAITTHIWFCVTHQLTTFLKQEQKHKNISFEDIAEIKYESAPYFERLTEDAQKVAEVVLTSPGRYVCLPQENVFLRLKNIMEQQGWPRSKTMNAINDLKFAYS